MAVVKYTLFVLLDGAGSQKNQHQSVVGVARGYKVGNCTPGVTDKMSVVAGGGRASPRAAEAGTWPGLVIILSPGTARPWQCRQHGGGLARYCSGRVHDPSCPALGPALGWAGA